MRLFPILLMGVSFSAILGVPAIQPTDDYNDVIFYNNTNGWIVGANGRILRTIDGASSFQIMTSGTTNKVNSIYFSSPSIGFAVGANGTVLRTTNAGTNWTVIAIPGVPGGTEFFGVFARGISVSTMKVWVAGSGEVLYRSEDGGSSWTGDLLSGSAVTVRSLYFTSDDIGIYVGDASGGAMSVRRTTDRGNTWQTPTIAAGTDNLYRVKFVDSTNGIAVGDAGRILKTADGGLNWTSPSSGTSNNLRGLAWISSTSVWVVGASGTILRSDSTGTSWASVTSPVSVQLNAVAVIDTLTSFAVGNTGTAIKSVTGESWDNILTPQPRINIKSISLASASRGLIAAPRGFAARTIDNDARRFLPFSTGTSLDLNSTFAFDDASTFGYAVGDSGRFILLTSTLATSKTTGLTTNLRGVWSSGPSGRVIIAGDASAGAGVIRYSDSQGDTWSTPTITGGPFAENLYAVSFSGSTGWVVGDSGRVLKSTDNAVNFASDSTGSAANYRAVYAFSSSAAFAVGLSGSDSVVSYWNGISWTNTTIAGVQLQTVVVAKWGSGASDKLAYFAGAGGVIRKTIDGTTFTTVISPTTVNLTSSTKYSAGGSDYVFIAGDNHTIIKTEVESGSNTEKVWSTLLSAVGNDGSITDVQFINSTTGWMVVGNQIKWTTDSGTNWANPTTGGSSVNDLSFVDASNGYAWGTGNDKVRKTVDGGVNWTDTSTVSRFSWKKIHTLSSTSALLVGEANTVLKTANSGTDWKFQNTRNDIRGVWVESASIANAVGANGMIMRTIDSGTTWRPLNSPGAFNFNMVFFSSATIGCAIRDDGRIYKTVDTGATWTEEKSADVNGQDITFSATLSYGSVWLAVGARLECAAICVQQGGIWRSTDSGDTWSQVYSSANTDQFNSVSFFGSTRDEAIAVGNSGVIARSTDGGQNWAEIAHGLGTPTLRGVSALANANGDRVVAVGESAVWQSSDFGVTWAAIGGAPVASFYSARILDIAASDLVRVVIAGSGVIYKFVEGTGWSTQLATTTDTIYKKLYFFDTSTGWAVGDRGVVVRSPDAGITWGAPQIARVGSGVDALRSVHFASGSATGWAVGGSSTAKIFRSTDSGDNWIEFNKGGAILNDVFATDGTTAWAVGNSGRILRRSSDTNWPAQTSSTTVNLNSVAFKDGSVGIAVGDNSSTSAVVVTTSDGGATAWTQRKNIGTYLSFKTVAVVPTTNTAFVGGNSATLITASDITAATPTWIWKSSGLFLTPYFPETSSGFLVGDLGTMIKSTNNGASWFGMNRPATGDTSGDLRSTYFIDRYRGWMCGDGGTILATTDSGSTWNSQSSGSTDVLKNIFFYDGNFGMATGDFLTRCRTTNGGTTWTAESDHDPITHPPTGFTYTSLYFATSSIGWLTATNGIGIHKTTDGGVTWNGGIDDPTLPAGLGNTLVYGVQFKDVNTGLLVGEDPLSLAGKIFRSIDGGANWTDVTPGGSLNRMIDVKWHDTAADVVIAVGSSTSTVNCTRKSTNGGVNWSTITLPPNFTPGPLGINLNRIRILTPKIAVLNLGSGNGFGIHATVFGPSTLSTTSGLNEFEIISAGSTSGPRVNFPTNGVTGFIAQSDGRVFKTTDSFKILTLQHSGGPTNSIWAVDENTALSVSNHGRIARMNSGSWSIATNILTEDFTDVQFLSSTVGFAVGANGLVMRTDDGGASWSVQSSRTQKRLNAVSFADTSNGLAVGSLGTIIRTTDGGSNWSNVTSNTTDELFDVHYLTAGGVAVAVGKGGRTLKSANGGAIWSVITPVTSDDLKSVRLTSLGTGVAVGTSGRYLTTANSGDSWVSGKFGNADLIHASFTGANGFICGVDNLVLKSADSGATWSVGLMSTINSMQFIGSTGFACSTQGRVITTTNSGVTWNFSSLGASITTTQTLNGLSFIDSSNGYVVGNGGTILKTANGGSTWSTESLAGGATTDLNSVHFVDATNAFACGASGKIYGPNSGWSEITPAVSETLNSIRMLNSTAGGNGWIIGDTDRKVQIASGGRANSTFGASVNFKSVWIVDPPTGNTVVAVGASGTIRRTVNGGGLWSTIISPTTQDLLSTFFVSSSTGYTSGANGALITSADSGASWTNVTTTTTMNLGSGTFSAADIVFFAGEEGVCVKLSLSAWQNVTSTLYGDPNQPTATIVIKATDPANSTYWSRLAAVNLELTASDDTGIDRVQYSNNGTVFSSAEPFSATKSWSLDISGGDGIKTVYYRVYDFANNSRTVSATIVYDATTSQASVVINSGASATNTTSVTLALSASDANGVKEVGYSNDGVSFTSEAFSLTKAWTLSSGDGIKTVYYRVIDNANNSTGTSIFDTILLDSSGNSNKPTATIVIKATDPANNTLFSRTTSVNLELTASDAYGISAVWYSNDGTFSGGGEAFATTKAWTLSSGDGTKTVYYKVRNSLGVETTVTANIYLDSSLPQASIVINSGAAATNTTSVTLTLSAASQSGVKEVGYSNDGISFTSEAFSATKAWTLTSGDGIKTVYYRVTDNTSKTATASDTILLDSTGNSNKPTATIVIKATDPANNTLFSRTTSVNLELTASDAYGISAVWYSNDGIFSGGGEAFAATKVWTLLSGDGTKTVYYKVRNSLGVETTVGANIYLDSALPQTSISINNGLTYTSDPNVTLTLSAGSQSGIKEVGYSNDGVTFTAETFATTKAWTLTSGDGIKTVYYRVTDNTNKSATSSDTIYLDSTGASNKPTASIVIKATDPVGSTLYTRTTTVNLELAARDETGIDKVWYSNNGTFTGAGEPFLQTRPWTLDSTGGDGIKTVYYKVRNFSSLETTVSTSIILDTTPPTATITINGGAPNTRSTVVSLSLTAIDLSGVQQVEYSNDNITFSPLEAFNFTKSWVLTSGDGLKNIYYRVTDNANNTSTVTDPDGITLTTLTFPTPSIIGPPNQITEGTPALLNWYEIKLLGEFYEVQWGTDPAFLTGLKTVNTTDNFYGIPSNQLTVGTTYHWRVRLKDNAGNAGPYATSSFQITSASSGTLTVTSLALGDINVPNDQQNVLMLKIIASAGSVEDVNISTIRINEVQTPNNRVTDLSSVRLYLDADSDGALNTAVDTLLGSTTYPSTTSPVTFSISPAVTVPFSAGKTFFVAYNLAGSAAIGNKYQTSIDSQVDILAKGASTGLTIIPGGVYPLRGRIVTIIPVGSPGSLALSKDPLKSPADGPVTSGQIQVDMLQFSLEAIGETITLNELAIQASGSANDSQAIRFVRLIHDANANGAFDVLGDTVLAQGTYSADNGTFTFTGLSSDVANSTTKFFLIQYDLTNTGFVIGDTITLKINPTLVKGTGRGSQTQIIATGLEQSGATKTFQNPGVGVSGSFKVTKITYAGAGKILPYQHDVVMLKTLIQASGFEDIKVTSISIRSSGTGNDPKDIASLFVVEDIDQNREYNPDIDTIIARANSPFSADNGLSVLSNLAIILPKGSSKTWIFVFNFSGWGEEGKTYKVIWDVKTEIIGVGQASNQTVFAEGDLIEGGEAVLAPLVGSSGKNTPNSCVSADSIAASRGIPKGPLFFFLILILALIASTFKRVLLKRQS